MIELGLKSVAWHCGLNKIKKVSGTKTTFYLLQTNENVLSIADLFGNKNIVLESEIATFFREKYHHYFSP
jgi:hypothetical protein